MSDALLLNAIPSPSSLLSKLSFSSSSSRRSFFPRHFQTFNYTPRCLPQSIGPTTTSSSSSYSSSSVVKSKQAAVQNNETPTSIDLVSITSEDQFDHVIIADEFTVILWMANWCRKCIYLKPKLEKLAADYYPRIRFYYVDVNTVPQRLVTRAGITKMPTIQLWKDTQKQAEVIGGHTAWLVVEDVRRMIENED